jgi:hypothetical protein
VKGDSEDNVQWHRVERSTSRGSQSLRFPDSADMASVQAELSNGLLCVCIRKKATLRRRQLQIGGGAGAGLTPAIQQQQQQPWPSEMTQERGVSGGGDTQQRVPISGASGQARNADDERGAKAGEPSPYITGAGSHGQGRGYEHERQGAKAGEPYGGSSGAGISGAGFGQGEPSPYGGIGGAGRAMEHENVPKVGDKMRGAVAAGTGMGGVGAALPGAVGERGIERGGELRKAGEQCTPEYMQPVTGVSGGMREIYPGAEALHLVKGPTYGEATSPGTVTGGERKKEGIMEPAYVATPLGKETRGEGLLEEEQEPRQHMGLGQRLKEGLKEAVGMGGERERESARGERAYGEGVGLSGRGSGAATVVHATQPEILQKFGEPAVPSGGSAVRERGQEVQGSGM